MLTHALVKEYFIYTDGSLFWNRVMLGGRLGERAGSQHHGGYRNIKIDGVIYLEHRVVWLYFNDTNPDEVDHKDQDKLNNRIENLRAATHGQNQRNVKSRGSSKWMGVSAYQGRWKAQTRKDGKVQYIGFFDNEEDAALAYNLWCYNNLSEEDYKFVNLNEVESK